MKLNKKLKITNIMLLMAIFILVLTFSVSFFVGKLYHVDSDATAGTVDIEFSKVIYDRDLYTKAMKQMHYSIYNENEEDVSLSKYVYMTLYDTDGNIVDLAEHDPFIYLYYGDGSSNPAVVCSDANLGYEIQDCIMKFETDKVVVKPGQHLSRSYIINIGEHDKTLDGSVLHFSLVLESVRRDCDNKAYSDLTIKTYTFILHSDSLYLVQG